MPVSVLSRRMSAKLRLHAEGQAVDAGRLEYRGYEIYDADGFGCTAPRAAYAVAPHHCERNVVGLIVVLTFYSREGHAVVGGDDYKCVVEFTDGIEHGDDTAQVCVEVFDLECVVEHIGAHGGIIGPVGRNGVDVGGIFAVFHR